MDDAAKYYANILMPLAPLVTRKIEEIVEMGMKMDMIAPSHGVIWRSEPDKIIDAYLRWSRGETMDKMVVAYDTMWGSTEKMARAIVTGAIGRV